jgi:hypothetical protein
VALRPHLAVGLPLSRTLASIHEEGVCSNQPKICSHSARSYTSSLARRLNVSLGEVCRAKVRAAAETPNGRDCGAAGGGRQARVFSRFSDLLR